MLSYNVLKLFNCTCTLVIARNKRNHIKFKFWKPIEVGLVMVPLISDKGVWMHNPIYGDPSTSFLKITNPTLNYDGRVLRKS